MEQSCMSPINYITIFPYIMYWGNNARNSKDKFMEKKLVQIYLIEYCGKNVFQEIHI